MRRLSNLRMSVVPFLILALVLGTVPGACARPAPAPVTAPTPAPAPAPVTAANFYKDNTAIVVVGYAAGGGTDYFARLVASFWPDATGGNARVNNMPGGASLVAGNFVWNAKPDGLTLYLCSLGSLAGPSLFKEPGMKFEMEKFSYIGMFGDEPYTLAVSKDSPYKSVADLQKAKGLKLATATKSGASGLGAVLGLHLLGLTDGVVISGAWGSSAEMALSVARRELDGYVFPIGTVIGDVGKGFVKPIVNIGFTKSQLLPDIPAISEVVKLSPGDETLLKVYVGGFGAGRVVLASPGVSPDRVEFMRAAFDKMVTLEGFRALVTSRIGAFETPINGKDTAAFVKEMAAVSPEIVARLKQLGDKYFR